ncbi:MFS general substrate transporter [Hypoxylon sp. FL1857]|nr:MFS general substrate transporter [Hypoxylon sp. FL1857]
MPCVLFVAKILNIFNWSKSFRATGVLAAIGLIFMATCSKIAIYCAAPGGLIYSVDAMTADTSKITNRGLAFAFTSSPYIITAFAGPSASERLYDYNWRWAFGCWPIIFPVVVLCLLARTDIAFSTWSDPSSRRPGALPSSLSVADSTADSWRSNSTITMLVIGFLMPIAFGLVECFITLKSFLPYDLVASRIVTGARARSLDLTYQVAYYCWDCYFSSYLQVVYGLNISTAVSATWMLGAGYLMRPADRFRWLLQIAANIGYVVMCEIPIPLAGGPMIIGEQVSVMAASEHNGVAAVLALLSLFGDVRLGCMGSDVRSAIIEAYTLAQTYMIIAGTVTIALSLVWVMLIKDVTLNETQKTKGMLF